MSTVDKLNVWLRGHDDNIHRFNLPVAILDVARETRETAPDIVAALQGNDVFHLWPHTYRGRESRTKPYCLRLNGPDTVGLDWENSVVGAAQAEFERRGYQTNRELGTNDHVDNLLRNPDVSRLQPAVNQRDLWAVRRDGDNVDLWIIEAKGKEAGGFACYCLAETLAQVFPAQAAPLCALLGSQKRPGHGLCWHIAQRLVSGWTEQGLKPTINLAVLVPEWSPDVIWRGRIGRVSRPYYSAPLSALRLFLTDEYSEALTGRYKNQRAFGQLLEDLERQVGIRTLARSTAGLRFAILTTRCTDGQFELSGLMN